MDNENQNPQGEVISTEAQPEQAPAPEVTADQPAEPKAKRAKVKEAKPADDSVTFLSRVPSLVIDIGDQKVEFIKGVVTVASDVAARLRRHHLFEHGHIFDGNEVVKVGNTYVVLSKESPDVQRVLRNGDKDVAIFCFPEAPNSTINLGDTSVQFANGKAVVDKKVAERLERHMFYTQGRMSKLEA